MTKERPAKAEAGFCDQVFVTMMSPLANQSINPCPKWVVRD
jgi:hypothetical protein